MRMKILFVLSIVVCAELAFADTEAQILGWRTPGAGQSPMVVTTPTVIALDGWRYGEIRLKRPQSCYWIDANGNGSFSLAEDVALTSEGLWIKGSLVMGALGIEVGDGVSTFTHTTSQLFMTSGSLTKVEVVDNGTSAVIIRIGLTQEAETSITLSMTPGVSVLDDLADVDTTTTAPTYGQALLWNDATGLFSPGNAGVSDHGALTGLADDDHPQYALDEDAKTSDVALRSDTETSISINRMNHVGVGDGSTTVPETRKLRFDPTWLSVTDEGSSGVLVEFAGLAGTYTTTDTIVARYTIYHAVLSAVGRFNVAIPQTYDHLEIKLVARSDVSATVDHVAIQLNADTTAANYRRTAHYGGSAHGAGASNDSIVATVPGESSQTGDFGAANITIHDYRNTSRNKDIVSLGTERQDATDMYSRFYTINWESTNAITSVTLQPDGWSTDQFATGTAVWIYGVKEIDVITGIAVGGMDGITTGSADLRYLKLDASNDPITASLGIDGNLSLNQLGPDADAYLYFYEGGSATGEHLKWDDGDSRFEMTDDLVIGGIVSADQLNSEGSVFLNITGPDGDSALYFYEGIASGEYLGWDDSEDYFLLSDDLRVTGNVRTANLTVAGRFLAAESGIPTLAVNDTTPDLSTNASVAYYTANTIATTITNFDNPVHAQIIIIIAGDSNTTIADNSNIILAGSANWTMGTDDTLTLLYTTGGSAWYEISRSDN